MKNVITYLKALWRRGLGSQSSDVSLDCRLTVGSPSVKYRLNLLRLVAISAFLLTIGVGNVWGTSYTITFATNSGDGTAITSGSTNASTIVASGSTSYVTGKVTSTYSYYAGGSGLKVGKSGSAGSVSFSIATSYQLTNPTIIVKAKRYNSSKEVKLNANSVGQITTPTDANWHWYSYNYSGKITSLTLNASQYCWVESVTITDECNAIDVTGGSAVILPLGSTTYNAYDWSKAGAPWAQAAAASYPISSNYYCVSFTQVKESKSANGLECAASSGVVSTTITSNYGVDVEIVVTGTNNFTAALTGASNVIGNNTTLTISTTSTSATLTISKTTSSAGYIKTIKITPKTASCSTNPTAGSASLNGSISLSSFPVQTTGWTVGSNCAWTDFGFVWSSTVSTPTLESNGTASSGCTKIQKATSGTSTSTTHSITGSFSTGTTYYVRGYGKNGYASGTYQYTDVLTITPRSVEFNSNGGSAVDTKYVNSGTKVTAPSDPTKTGYNFGEWQLNSSEFDFANTNVTSNITLVATWTAKTTTISFNQTSGTGGQTGTLTATYGSAMPAISGTPTREGYDFGGYYDGSGGTGTKYYNADGSSATNWDKENSTWTLYAKWTVKSYSVTWKVNNTNYSAGGSTSVNHGSRVATLPTAPDPGDYCGDKFVGWTTDAEYVHNTSPLFTAAGSAPVADGAQIFYAVFADYDE